jgi:alkylhydroperoxidase family enzyme
MVVAGALSWVSSSSLALNPTKRDSRRNGMPHVAPLSDAQASAAAKGLFQALQSKLGMVPNIYRTMGHAPDVLQATLALNGSIHKDLDPKLRELAYLKTSQLNGCEY